MTNHLVKDCRKRLRDEKHEGKTENLMVINNDMELQTSTSVPNIELDTDIMDDDDTMKAFNELGKILQITKISDLYPLLTKTNHTKFANHTPISNMVCEVFMPTCKIYTGTDNLVNNIYLSIFKILKRVLISISTLKLIIKRSCVLKNIYNTNKKVSNI